MNFRSLVAATLIAFGLPCLSGAEDTVLRMKSGDVKLTILDPDGIRPLANVDVKVQDAREASRLIQATTDRSGSCGMTLEEGTYGLSIDGKAVALIASSPDAETAHLRLVTPRKPLLIGGAEGAAAGTTNVVEAAAGVTNATPAQIVAEEENKRRGLFYWVGNNGLTTALIVGGAVATGVIIENNTDGSSSSPTASPTTPATPSSNPSARRTPRPSTPDIDRPVSN